MSEENPFETASERNYLEELVGEGKKFKTVDELAKGKWQSDDYIETLKAKIVNLEAQNANGMNVEKLREEILRLNAGKDENDGGQPPVQTPAPSTPDIEDLVLQTLRKTEAERTTQTNTQATISKMKEVWGGDAGKKLAEVATEINTSVETLREIAAQSPQMFYRLTGLDQDRTPSGGTTVPTSSVRFDNRAPDRDAAYYRELKKTNPSLYKETSTQIQMHRDAQRLGEKFFN